jgi:hypothetical protein
MWQWNLIIQQNWKFKFKKLKTALIGNLFSDSIKL